MRAAGQHGSAEVKSRHQTDYVWRRSVHGPRLQPFFFLNGNNDARVDDDIFITYVNVPSPTLNTDAVRDTELEGSGLPDNQNLISSYGTDNSSMKTANAPEKDISVKDPGVHQPLTPVPVTAGARSDSVALLLQPSTPMVVDVSPPSPPMNIPERPCPLNVTDAPSYLFGCVLPVTLSGWLEVGGDIALQTLAIEALQLALMRRFDKLGGSDSVQPLLYEIFRRISESRQSLFSHNLGLLHISYLKGYSHTSNNLSKIPRPATIPLAALSVTASD